MSFALVEIETGKEVRLFSGDALPNPLVWPNGDASHAATVGEERVGYRFVKVEYDQTPGEFHDAVSEKAEVAGAIMLVSRKWQPRDLEATKEIVTGRLRSRANDLIMELVPQAELARALVSGKIPDWAEEVRTIDAQLAKALKTVKSAGTVDEAAEVETTF